MTRRPGRDCAAVSAGVVSLALVVAAPGHAIEDCGVGMYYNAANAQCEPWAPVGVDFAPAVAVPVLDPVPLGIGFDPVPLGIGFDPGFGLNVPNIAPYLRVPGIPGIPGVPDLRVPDVRVPDVRVPDVRVPDVRVPEVRVPEIHPRR